MSRVSWSEEVTGSDPKLCSALTRGRWLSGKPKQRHPLAILALSKSWVLPRFCASRDALLASDDDSAKWRTRDQAQNQDRIRELTPAAIESYGVPMDVVLNETAPKQPEAARKEMVVRLRGRAARLGQLPVAEA